MEVCDAFFKKLVQTVVDGRGECKKVLFGLAECLFGSRAVAVARRGRLSDRFEVFLQWAGLYGWNQALARTSAGDQQGDSGAEQRHDSEAYKCLQVH
jgi:hypothetical protein